MRAREREVNGMTARRKSEEHRKKQKRNTQEHECSQEHKRKANQERSNMYMRSNVCERKQMCLGCRRGEGSAKDKADQNGRESTSTRRRQSFFEKGQQGQEGGKG